MYHRLFDHHSNKFEIDAQGNPKASRRPDDQSLYNILLLVAIVFTFSVDTSICERGFALMNNLKTARRSQMGNLLLRTLMTICDLGKEWKDPNKIPVDEIVEEWRSQSGKGRYEAAMWREAGLEEPGREAASGASGDVEEGNAAPGDFQYNWDQRKRAQQRAFPQAAAPTPAPTAHRPAALDDDGLDDE